MFGLCISIIHLSGKYFSARSEVRASPCSEGLCLDCGIRTSGRKLDIWQEQSVLFSHPSSLIPAPQIHTQVYHTPKSSHKSIDRGREGRRKADKQAKESNLQGQSLRLFHLQKNSLLSRPMCFNSGRTFHNRETRSHKSGKNSSILTPIPMVPDKP